jgi:hypothetical protein
MNKIDQLITEMIRFDTGEPELIQHFIKVHEFARLIGLMEDLPSDEQEVLEAAAVVHDIGIKICMQKFGRCDGKLQEQEGPAYAEDLLSRLAFSSSVIERVSWLVAHHHTYTNIDRPDYQILIEADFLVNLFENQNSMDTIKSTYTRIFKTEAGRKLCREMFSLEDNT